MSEEDEAQNILNRQTGKRQWQDYGLIKDKVVNLLEKNPQGLTGAKISDMIGITPGAMSKYLSMLDVDGIITSRKVGVAKLWKLISSTDRTEFLATKMGSETVNFKDYALSLTENDGILLDPDNKRILTMPTIMLTNLYEYTATVVGSEVHAFFHEWGKSFATATQDLVNSIAEKTNGNFIQSFLILLRLQGWGRFSIDIRNGKSIEVIWQDSIWSSEATNSNDNTPVDDFMVGALSIAASLTFGGTWQFIEVQCRSVGAPICKFTGSIST